jgi:hypothetical protein
MMEDIFPVCKVCGERLINGLDMGKELCGQCWFDTFEFWEENE